MSLEDLYADTTQKLPTKTLKPNYQFHTMSDIPQTYFNNSTYDKRYSFQLFLLVCIQLQTYLRTKTYLARPPES